MSIDSQLQNGFFKEFEQGVYYDRYFKELRARQDGRKFQQSRKMNIVLNSLKNIHGNCIIKKGKMLIVCEIKAHLEEQFINVLTNRTQVPLFKVEVSLPETRQLTTFQKKKKQSSISYSIQQELQKLDIQSQLLTKNKHKVHGYRLDIQIRVLSEDGCIHQHCLLAAQLALQTTKLRTLVAEGESIKQSEPIRVLQLKHFVFPNTLCSVNRQPIIDPSQQEQMVQSYSLTNWIDIITNDSSVSKSGTQQLQYQIILKFQQQVDQERQNIRSKLNLKDIVSKVLSDPTATLNIELKI